MRDRSQQEGGGRSERARNAGRRERTPLSRRTFLGGVGAAAVSGAMPFARSARAKPAGLAGDYPHGVPLRVKPVLTYSVPQPREKTSWRSYGGVKTEEAARKEVGRIRKELKQLRAVAEFPVEFLPVAAVHSPGQGAELADCDCDLFLVYPAEGAFWSEQFLPFLSQTPTVFFVRHREGPFYLGHEVVHWRFLRRNGDTFRPDYGIDDVAVDEPEKLLWRLRAHYGLKNARGTTMLAIGGLSAYSTLAQQQGPKVAREVWDYRIETVPREEFARRLARTREDAEAMRQAERRADELLARDDVTLETERRFVVNSFAALQVCEDLLREAGAGWRGNFGFAGCMGRGAISMLDTPPCLVLSLANDLGYTAYCHADLSHTMPGVLLRWVAGRPAFVANSHFPHDGLFTVAHCAAPRRMDGTHYEPTTIMTHYESDYGAATKVHYRTGQTVTVVVPNLRCSKWFGFRGEIVETPSHPACRSQTEIRIDGDWRSLAREMEGFHVQIVYGDYLREIGYALEKLGDRIEWRCYSPTG